MNSTSCNMCFWALWSIWSIFVWIGLVFQPNLIIFGPDRDQGSPGIVRSPFGPQILLRKLKGIYLDDKICKLGRLPPPLPAPYLGICRWVPLACLTMSMYLIGSVLRNVVEQPTYLEEVAIPPSAIAAPNVHKKTYFSLSWGDSGEYPYERKKRGQFTAVGCNVDGHLAWISVLVLDKELTWPRTGPREPTNR